MTPTCKHCKHAENWHEPDGWAGRHDQRCTVPVGLELEYDCSCPGYEEEGNDDVPVSV